MTTTPPSDARQEAERRYPETQPHWANRRMVSPGVGDMRDAFEDGAEWKGAQVAERLERLESIVRAFDKHLPPDGVGSPRSIADYDEDELDAIFDGIGLAVDVAHRALSGVESSDEGEADGE